MAEIDSLNVSDDSNTGRWPEGMAYAAVNNAGRADEGMLARWFQDTNASITASGSSNAYAITSNRTISSLVNNQVMAWTSNHANTGAATLNLNGLGAAAIKRPNGDALLADDIVSGQAVITIYKSSTGFWYLLSTAGALLVADQTAMEAATSVTANVTPGRQHSHPGHPKFWAYVTVSGGTPTLVSSYNVSGITDTSQGKLTITFSTAFSSADYCVSVTVERASGENSAMVGAVENGGKATGSVIVHCMSTGASANATFQDPAAYYVVGWGDQ